MIQLDADSTANVLNDVEVLYGGSNGNPAELYDQGGPLTLSNSTVSNSRASGVRLQQSTATLDGDTISDNGGPAISMDLASNPAIAGLEATGNNFNGVLADSGALPASLAWTSPNTVYTLAGGVTIPQGDTLTIGSGAVLTLTNGGDLGGSGTLSVAGALLKSADNSFVTVSPLVNVTGTLEIDSGTLDLAGGLTLGASAILTGTPAATLQVGGNLGGAAQQPNLVAPVFPVVLNGSGAAATPQTIEVMGQDLGNVAAGFSDNFVDYSLALGNNTYVKLVNAVQNSGGAGAEALYTDYLNVPGGTTLDLNGLHVYTRVANLQGTVLNGTVSVLPNGGPLTEGVTAAAALASGTTDIWTIFGRPDLDATLVVNTGGSGSIPPPSSSLNFATVTIKTPEGQVLTTKSNTQSGADIVFTGLNLTEDANYQVLVQAGQTGGSGNYNITAYDAAPQTNPLTLNQTTTGTLANLYQSDAWTFTATAGEVVQFNLINASNPGIEFTLTGPNGYTGFTNATAGSGPIALPSAGTYTLTVHSAAQAGSCAFAIVDSTVTSLKGRLEISFFDVSGVFAGGSHPGGSAAWRGPCGGSWR